ncbi:unnamed protein product (macronuclear) [Paramecium tetraurelia]|uniref:Armadillo-type fold n=1 Tax=Paramecium tetraurelia TaxID=5888 RepID=A0C9D0_PARTE|nr:uncharacterized protein GSPATT00006703001 [Paramecium tetraurelia]CAK67397.1 unnamed protein product [Paramecium tetraurelia]|eukprot:XP_001434794.1 hypothetical protein (macronuclear) [Paramecium tetraurelia strain d4-2]
MNRRDIVENELISIKDYSKKYPQLCKVLESNLLELDSHSLLQQLLPQIVSSKNIKLIQQGIGLIQKLQHLSSLNTNDLDIIIEYFNISKQQQDETIDIRLVSTLIHIIGPDIIDFQNSNQILKVLDMLIYFSSSNNPIIAQSSIQGILTISNVLEELLQNQQNNNAVLQSYFELLELFFKIFQDKEQSFIYVSNNLILCKDIFIIILKCGKYLQQIKQFHTFYHETLYTYLKSIDLVQESNIMNKINTIRLIFNYIQIVDDKFDLIAQLMTTYSKLQQFDQSKIAIHDGILCLYSNLTIFKNLLIRQPFGNNFSDYNDLILKSLYQYSLFGIKEFFTQQSPKQNILINKLTASYIECNLQMLPNIFVQQIKTLIQIITENIQKFLQLDEFQNEGTGLLQEIKNYSRLIQSQVFNGENEDQMAEIQETENDDIRFKTFFDKLWRPLLKIMKQILKIANNQQYINLLEYLQSWTQFSLEQDQTNTFQLLIRFLAAQSAPLSLKYDENDKWLIACKVFEEILYNNVNFLTAKTWNLIFQTLQRIEQVVSKSTSIKMTTELFYRSSQYQDTTVFQMVDGLNQLALQVSERLQISQKKTFDSIYKSFAIDKLLLIIDNNWQRIHQLWTIIDALYFCLCSSKVMEMRLNAIHKYRDTIISGIEYSKNNKWKWGDKWVQYLLNPLSELIMLPYEDLKDNILQIISNLIHEHHKYLPSDAFQIFVLLFEVLLNDFFSKEGIQQELSQQVQKQLIFRTQLSIQCMFEILSNHIEGLDNTSICKLASILIQLDKESHFNFETTNKIIYMTWQIQERLVKLKITDHEFWQISMKLFKNCLDNQDDLKYASIHISSQICCIAQESQFTEMFQILEELIQYSMEYFLKVEQHQLLFIQQTPRFLTLPMETPKFSGSIKQMVFDKSTSLQLFKQQFELVKLCISRMIDVIIHKSLYPKFYYYLQLFNQAQCVYVKHEIAMACQKIIKSNSDKQLIIGAIDFLITIINNEQTLDVEDVQFYIENKTFQIFCDVIKLTVTINHKKGLHALQLLFNFLCQDQIILHLNDDNNIFKYYHKSCLQFDMLEEDIIAEWFHFLNQQISQLSVNAKHHLFIEFLINSFEALISKRQLNKNEIEEVNKFIGVLNDFLSKCQLLMNDNSEKLQLILFPSLNNILIRMIPFLDYNQIEQLFEPLITSQLANSKKRTQDLVSFFVNDAQSFLNSEQQDVVVQLFTNYYINKLKISDPESQQLIIISLVAILERDNSIVEKFSLSIRVSLLNSIHENFQFFLNEENTSLEKQLNIQSMLDFLSRLEKDDLKEFYLTFVKMIKCESLEIRTKLITILSKYV